MSKQVIREDELLAYLAEMERPAGDPGETAAEMAERIGHCVEWTRHHVLARARSEGRLVLGRRHIVSVDGRNMTVKVYRILPAKGVTRGQK